MAPIVNSKTTERDFLAELEEVARAARAAIEARKVGLDPTPAARGARRRRVLVERDFSFFAYTYLSHHIRPPASAFHRHFFGRFPALLDVPGGVKEWWIAPRGEAKSSLLTKVGPTWCAVRALLQTASVRREMGEDAPDPYAIDYIVLLGAETKLPTKLLEVVKVELQFNASLALDFPEVSGASKHWKVGQFVTRSGMMVESFGAEQAIRGTFHGSARPKLLLGDDLITDKEAKSPTERDTRWDWLEKAVDYLGPPDGSVKYLGVGTILNKDDPISRAKSAIGHLVHHFRAIETLPKNMDLWQENEEVMRNQDKPAEEAAAETGGVLTAEELPSYRHYAAHRAEMDEGAVISWPEVRSLYGLMRQRAKNRAAFNTEMQGDPRTDEDKVFGRVGFSVARSDRWRRVGACDPSMGQGHKSDPSAILGGCWDVDKSVLHVLEATIRRRTPSKLESDLVAFQRRFEPQAIAFENNNAYEHMRQSFVRSALAAGVTLPLIGITAVTEQDLRIEELEPFVTDAFAPRILFDAGLRQLLDELDTWPDPQPGHHYDGLCALWLLWQAAVRYGRGTAFVPVAKGSHTAFPHGRSRSDDRPTPDDRRASPFARRRGMC